MMATASSTATARTARSTVKWSPRKPISGGPAKNAQYPIDAMTLTRDAAIAGSSAPALIPTGNTKARLQLRSAVSPDGIGWSAGGPLPGQPLPAGGRAIADAAALPRGGAVAGITASGRAELWVSPDGRRWAPEVVPGRADQASGVVLGADPDRIVLVVQTPAGPQVYIGRRVR
jgi:hypothetical protein